MVAPNTHSWRHMSVAVVATLIGGIALGLSVAHADLLSLTTVLAVLMFAIAAVRYRLATRH